MYRARSIVSHRISMTLSVDFDAVKAISFSSFTDDVSTCDGKSSPRPEAISSSPHRSPLALIRSQLSPLALGSPPPKRLHLQTADPKTSQPTISSAKESPIDTLLRKKEKSLLFQQRSSKKNVPHYPTIQLQTQRPFSSTTNANRYEDVTTPSTTHGQALKSVVPIVLSAEQEHVLQLVRNGESLFYTGSAGTGKSVLLRAIIKELRKKHDGNIAVTASTGLAACNIGGITLHSFAGVGLGDGSIDNWMKKVRSNKKAYSRWGSVKVLIIDEILMIDGIFFDKLNELAKRIRRSRAPFGGIQVIACGDFYQLPPVNKNKIDGSSIEESMFAFESMAWKSTIKKSILLQEVFRQKGDQRFIDMLNEMRSGQIGPDTEFEFKKLARKLECPEGIVPAELYSTRYEVDNANNTRLNLLKGETHLFSSVDDGSLPAQSRQTVLNNFLAPQKLFLKKNAQVMCIKNFDETLVNGSLGQVVGFMDKRTYKLFEKMKASPDVPIESLNAQLKDEEKNTEDKTLNDYSSQQYNDSVFGFLDEVPETNFADTELFSSEELNNSFKESKERKLQFINKMLEEADKKKLLPLVRFLLPDGVNTREVLVEPETWTVEDEHQQVLASRTQVPLMLAWSLSIHKSQGQTLPKVKVDLKRVFENGQAYVALSRAVSRAGLQVLNFDKYKIKAHPKVIDFYSTLFTPEESIADRKHEHAQRSLDHFFSTVGGRADFNT